MKDIKTVRLKDRKTVRLKDIKTVRLKDRKKVKWKDRKLRIVKNSIKKKVIIGVLCDLRKVFAPIGYY